MVRRRYEIIIFMVWRRRRRKVELPEKEISALVALLNRVRITGGGSEEFKDLTGNGPYRMFYIELIDGTSFEFAGDSSRYIINGEIGYETENHETGREIMDMYYALVEEYCKRPRRSPNAPMPLPEDYQ